MHPVAHTLVACSAIKVCEPALRRVVRAETRIDYRFVAAGALLPDAVDKPFAWILIRGSVEDSHLVGHTLLFALVIVAVGLLLARRGEVRVLLVGLGALFHLPVDPVVRNPSTLLWPLFGTEFDYAPPVVPFSFWIDVLLILFFAFAARSEGWRERLRWFFVRGEFSWSEVADAPEDGRTSGERGTVKP